MKIAFDYQAFSMQRYGGISRYFHHLSNGLRLRGNDIKIYGGFYLNEYISWQPNSAVKGIKLKRFPPKTGKIFKLINHCIDQAYVLKDKPDVFHETYYSCLPGFDFKSLRVVTAYDMIHELYSHQFPSADQTTKKKKIAFERADKIICISNNTKHDLLRNFKISESKVSVVHLGVNLDQFKLPQKSNLLDLTDYILFVGSRDGYKNFELFLKSCSESLIIKNQIKIVAFGGGTFTNKELELIKSLGFQQNFVQNILGDDNTLASLYRNAICFIYPSKYEGFGIPPLEAMAAECPVVASNTSSIPEVVNNAGVYFNPYSIDDMRTAIESVLENEKLRLNLIELGLKNIRNFTWEECSQKTEQVYQNL